MSREREDGSQRLAAYLEARADELDLDWVEVAREAGITVETLRAVRRGNNLPSRATRKGLDRALKWESGSVQAILDGGEPTALARAELDPDVRGPNETGIEWMDRQYELWKADRDKRALLKSLFESLEKRDAS